MTDLKTIKENAVIFEKLIVIGENQFVYDINRNIKKWDKGTNFRY